MFHLLKYISRSEISDHVAVVFLAFTESTVLFSVGASPIYIPTNNLQGFPFLHIFSSVAKLCPTFCHRMDCSTPGLPVHHQLPEPTQTHVHHVSDAILPSHPLSPLLLPHSIFPSIRVFSSELVLCIRWPKYWNFSFCITPSSEYSGLISFRIDWLFILAFHGTLKSLLQHHSSKASILWRSAIFIVQLSSPYMTTGKTVALTRRTLGGEVVSLLFNMLSRLVHILVNICYLCLSDGSHFD